MRVSEYLECCTRLRLQGCGWIPSDLKQLLVVWYIRAMTKIHVYLMYPICMYHGEILVAVFLHHAEATWCVTQLNVEAKFLK